MPSIWADDESLVHSVDALNVLQRQLNSTEVGENVQRGPNIRQMHESAMKRGSTSRGNILRGAYSEFGMATALGKDGKLYMVQLFRGLSKEKKTQLEKDAMMEEAAFMKKPVATKKSYDSDTLEETSSSSSEEDRY